MFENWQIAIRNYFGQIFASFTFTCFAEFYIQTSSFFPVRCKQSPIPNAQIAFTDRSTNGKAFIVTKNHQKVLKTQKNFS